VNIVSLKNLCFFVNCLLIPKFTWESSHKWEWVMCSSLVSSRTDSQEKEPGTFNLFVKHNYIWVWVSEIFIVKSISWILLKQTIKLSWSSSFSAETCKFWSLQLCGVLISCKLCLSSKLTQLKNFICWKGKCKISREGLVLIFCAKP